MLGRCRLCLESKSLSKSHAIPDSIFKRILRKNSGKGIALSLDDRDIAYSGDSWWDYQLCTNCEGKLNNNYENYSLRVLRGGAGNVSKHKEGISFNGIDLHKLNMFFISIFWRSSISKHSAYSQMKLGGQIDEYFRTMILNDSKIPISVTTVTISRLIDYTRSGGFSLNSLKELIVPPVFNGNEFCFVFEGFYLQVHLPGLKVKERSKPGVIRPTRNILFVPFNDIFSIPVLHKLMVVNYGKHIAGKSRIKSRQS